MDRFPDAEAMRAAVKDALAALDEQDDKATLVPVKQPVADDDLDDAAATIPVSDFVKAKSRALAARRVAEAEPVGSHEGDASGASEAAEEEAQGPTHSRSVSRARDLVRRDCVRRAADACGTLTREGAHRPRAAPSPRRRTRTLTLTRATTKSKSTTRWMRHVTPTTVERPAPPTRARVCLRASRDEEEEDGKST